MANLPDALEIWLHKTKPMAPPFHKHIAKNKMIGSKWQAGDQVIIYEITDTEPKGTVLVTMNTIIHFDSE